MKAKLTILYRETWVDQDPDWNYVMVELRRYEKGRNHYCDFVLETEVTVRGEIIVADTSATMAGIKDMRSLRIAIAAFDDLKKRHPDHPDYIAKPENNNSLGSGQC